MTVRELSFPACVEEGPVTVLVIFAIFSAFTQLARGVFSIFCFFRVSGRNWSGPQGKETTPTCLRFGQSPVGSWISSLHQLQLFCWDIRPKPWLTKSLYLISVQLLLRELKGLLVEDWLIVVVCCWAALWGRKGALFCSICCFLWYIDSTMADGKLLIWCYWIVNQEEDRLSWAHTHALAFYLPIFPISNTCHFYPGRNSGVASCRHLDSLSLHLFPNIAKLLSKMIFPFTFLAACYGTIFSLKSTSF